MLRRITTFLASVAVVACLEPSVVAQGAPEVAVKSPDGTIRLALQIASNGSVLYSVERNGRQVVEPSLIDVRLSSDGSIADGASITDSRRWRVDQSSELLWGKTRRIHNLCGAAAVRLKGSSGIVWDVELRAYDDGVAFRYLLPKQQGRSLIFAIEDENTEFRLAGDPMILFTTCKGFTTSHESLYERKPLSGLPPATLFDTPLLAVWPDGSSVAVTEGRLRDYAGMYLERADETNRSMLRTRLAPPPGGTNTLVIAKTPHASPWRAILMADHAGKLIESNLLQCLNEPADGDFSWVKPGKTTFHWWNGSVEHSPESTPDANFAIHKKYIDFCAQNKIGYHTVISVSGNRPWYVQRDPGFHDAPHPDTDITKPRPDIDLPRILEYANERGVGIRFWVHWKPLSQHLEEAFAQYERWGIRGLMVDFMDRDDQEMVGWQEKCLRAAARHKLHVQFHGSHKPTGEERTFPNLFNREGALNLEYSKWNDEVTPAHNVNVAYTRLLAGPVDYHLGGFRAATREEFEPRDMNPLVLGTRSHQLALYVVFDNPMPMLADDPSAYECQSGFDFLVEVPTTWDETRFVAGEAGKYIVVARRSGDRWYLGGITNWSPRKLQLPLDFLDHGRFEAKLYGDVSPDGKKPNELRQEIHSVSKDHTLDVSLAVGGGVVAVIRPK